MATAPNVTVDSLRRLEVFAGLPDPSLDRLLRLSAVRRLVAKEPLSARPSPMASGLERYCFVLEGAVAIALRDATVSELPRAAKTPRGHTLEYIGHLRSGACFSDGFLKARSAPSLPEVDCIATTETTLLQLDAPSLAEFMSQHGSWGQSVARRVFEARAEFLSHQEPRRRVVQDFYLRENLSTSSTVRVRRLDHCLDCNKCHDACAERHGASRMIRFGPTLGKLAFPTVCRRCDDKPCIPACGFGAITVDGGTGDIRILDNCTGCGACAEECPNGAISMLSRPYLLADFPDPLPLNSPQGLTNVSNLYVAGDVAGAALIRVAMNQAVEAVDAVGPRRSQPHPRLLDVVIVGGGPAGLAAAIRCQERKLSYVVLEKERLASTIRDYPKNKHVMAEPSSIPLKSSLWFEDCSKEELIARWQNAVAERQIPIEEGAEVRSIEDQGTMFKLEHTRGESYAEHVVVCIGKRGSPRKLGIPGETFPRVRYSLSDADEFAGRNVVVVGGGDSALEAALSLADAQGTKVTLSYRQGEFKRAKALNRQRLQEYQSAGRLCVILNSTVSGLEPGAISIRTESGVQRFANDFVIALLGAEPPTGFLQQAGIRVLKPGSEEMAQYAGSLGERPYAVKCDNCAGFSERACLTVCPTKALVEVEAAELFKEATADPRTRTRRFSLAPFMSGRVASSSASKRVPVLAHRSMITLLVLGLVVTGIESFLRATQPELSLTAHYARWAHRDMAVGFSSGRGFGHWLGYIGASMMLASVLYSLRTRIKRFARLGSPSGWLSAHLWLGFAGGTLVTYHSALKLDRWASIACIMIWVIVVTGAVGRYVYGRAHSARGLAEFELNGLRRALRALGPVEQQTAALRTLLGEAPKSGNATAMLAVVLLWHELRDRVLLLGLWLFGARNLGNPKERRKLLRNVGQWAANRRRSSYYQASAVVLNHWNRVHIVLAILMFILAGIHIVYGFMYKAV